MGVLTLQPTLSAASKQAGRTRHQIFQLGIGFPLILAGSSAVYIYKERNGWAHFSSLHSVSKRLLDGFYKALIGISSDLV